MKKICTTLALILGLYGLMSAQLVTIKDKETGKPIESVTLMSFSPRAFATANAEGQADVSGFKNAEKIEISSLGYTTQTLSFGALERMSFVVFLMPGIARFDEIVVSATRWSQFSRSVPSRIAKISPADVALQNPQTAADLLGASGEVFIQKSQQGGGSPMIRGFATNRLLYAVDGVRMNSAIFRAGNIQNVISLDPLAMESTEVFFGPGSIIYGSDAIGGVMSFQTLTPQLALDNHTLTQVQSLSRFASANKEWTHHFNTRLGWKKWASVTSLTYSDFGNLRMGRKGPDEYLKTFYVQRIDNTDRVFENPEPRVQNPSGYDQINVMQKIRFRPNNHWDFQYGFHYAETSDYARYDRLIEQQSSGLPVAAVWNYGPQIWMMNHLSVTRQGPGKLWDQFTLRLAQQYFEESRTDRRFNQHRLRTQLEEVQALSANLDMEKVFKQHRFYYGLEYILNEVGSFGSAKDIRDGTPIPVPDRYPASRWNTVAGYLNYQYVATDKFILQAGARFSSFGIHSDFSRHLEFFPFDFTRSDIRNAATTGGLGMVFHPNKAIKISLNGSTGFRAPNVDDIGKIFDFGTGEVIVPNTSLRAEYAWNGELAISGVVGEILNFDAAGFYTHLNDAMVRRPFQVGGRDSILYNGQLSRVFAIQNAAFGTVYGFHIGLELALPSGLSLASRFNYQKGREEMDDGEVSPSRHAAPAFGDLRLSYRRQNLTLQGYALYSAAVSFDNLNTEEKGKPAIYARDLNGNPYSPGWWTLNYKAMYQIHPNFQLSGGIENILDRRYRPYSSGLVAPGRNFILSLRTSF